MNQHRTTRHPRRVRTGLATLVAAGAIAAASATVPADAASSTPDAGGYRFVDSTEPYGPAGGPFTSIASTGQDIGNHCDDCTTTLSLPFAVDLYADRGIVQVNASSNGDLQVKSASTWPGTQQPNTYMDTAIQPFHADLRTDKGGGIYTQVTGTAPHRQLVVEWVARDANDVYSSDFQVVLTEESREIQFRYLSMDAPTLGHNTGIQDGDGSGGRYTMYSDFGRRISDGLAVSFRHTTTAVTLTGPSASPVAGQKVALTARVARADGGITPPTGSVLFTEGATTLGTATISPRGTAVLTTTSLPVGHHEVVATHLADNGASTGGSSRRLFVEVRPASTSTTIEAPTTTTYGTAIPAKLRVLAPGTGTPTGNVRWYDGDRELALTPLSKGLTTLPPTALAPGAHQLTAVLESVDGRYARSSGTSTVTVVRAAASASLVVSPNPVVRGKKVKLSATVRGVAGAAVPTGTVTFTDGGVVLGEATLDTAGRASLSWTASTAGSHSLQATYAGDDRYDGRASAPVDLTVQ